MPVEEFPSSIWIRDYLEHVRDFGEVQIVTDVQPFDSNFEQEVHAMLTAAVRRKTFRVDNQVQSCGFRIDLVLTNTATGEALAIECDGPTHFSSESEDSYVESDIERQLALEAAGWNFERIRYSDWISDAFDRNLAIRSIISRLTTTQERSRIGNNGH
jgi:very-short-patch-repair endonuclease